MSERAPKSLRVHSDVEFSRSDDAYIATSPAYPMLSGVGDTEHDARESLAEAILAVDEIMAEEQP